MNEKIIIVNYDPFAIKSEVSIFMNEQEVQKMNLSSKIKELSENLISLAYMYDTYSIKVYAHSSTTEEIKRIIEEREKNIYSSNRIKVEGI